MPDVLPNFLFTTQLVPHGHCYLWKPGLVGLHILSDALIALADYSIAIMLVYFVRQRRDVSSSGKFLMFGSFIVACGTTHLIEIWTLWHPTYWLSELLKAITAMVCVCTAVSLVPLIPKALTLPSPAQLEVAYLALKNEISDRQRTEELLRNDAQRFSAIIATQFNIATVGLDLHVVMELIVERAEKLTQASGAVIELVEGDEMVYRSASGTAAPHVGMRLKKATSLSGQCVQTREILSCDDTEIDPRVNAAACRQVKVRSMIVVPLNHHCQTIGVLKVFSHKPYAFNERDIHTLQLMAGLLASAINQASEFEANQLLLTERMAAYSALQESEQRFRDLVEQATDGLFVYELDGRIVDVNQEACNSLGYTKEELLTLSVADIEENFVTGRIAQLWEQMLPGIPVTVNGVHRRKDGKTFPVEVRIGLFQSDGRRLILALVRDITERQRAQVEMLKAKELAEAANRAKSEFLANMSHEIRTPMNGVIGMTGLLLDTELKPQQRDFVETIRCSGEALLTIINDILDFSKIEAGRLELESHPFDLRMCVESALDLLALTAAAKNLDLGYLMDHQTPSWIVGDKWMTINN